MAERGRTSGMPSSANGASSLHAWWDLAGPLREVAVTLEVLVPPAVPWLYFWALQVSFVDRGRRAGGGHLGLQAAPWHPGGTAVRWSDAAAVTAEGAGVVPPSVRLTYQSVADGGCSNSSTFVDGAAVVQATATDRRVAHGTTLPLGATG